MILVRSENTYKPCVKQPISWNEILWLRLQHAREWHFQRKPRGSVSRDSLAKTASVAIIFCGVKDMDYICIRFETAGEIRVCFIAII